MSDAAVKESRRVLRLVQAHLSQSHANLGVQQQTLGLVEVMYHPENNLPHLNYVSPRQKTAWVPGPEVEKGLSHLESLGRAPRVSYIEGLYPPLFAQSLRQLGLEVESETPIMTYTIPEGRIAPQLPDDLHVEYPDSQDGVALWWYVWRNARYDVQTGGAEPVYIGRDLREIMLGSQRDVLLYRYRFPVGVARLTIHNTTANISAIALMKEVRTPEMLTHLYQMTIQAAVDKGCEIVFMAVPAEQEQRICRSLGFINTGNLVTFARTPEQINAEPLFMFG